MTTRDDLVGRLREAHANSQQRVFGSHIFEEAASALEAMKAEIARLRDEIETADRNHRQMAKQMAELGRQLAAETERCALIAENAFGGKAHTYASENADLYRGQDMACQRIAAAIRGGGRPPDIANQGVKCQADDPQESANPPGERG